MILLQSKTKVLYLLPLIVMLTIFTLITCDPVGDYLIEVIGVTYQNGYVVVVLSPAYGGMRIQNFSLTDHDEQEIEIVKVHLNKKKDKVYYYLELKEGVVLSKGSYLVKIEKYGFRFLHRDYLKDDNLSQLIIVGD